MVDAMQKENIKVRVCGADNIDLRSSVELPMCPGFLHNKFR